MINKIIKFLFLGLIFISCALGSAQAESIEKSNDPSAILSAKAYKAAVHYSEGPETAEVIGGMVVSDCWQEISNVADELVEAVSPNLQGPDKESRINDIREKYVKHYEQSTRESAVAVVIATRNKLISG